MDVQSIAADHGVGVLSGVLGTMLINEMVSRFFRRGDHAKIKAADLESKAEERRDGLIKQLLDQVTGVRSALEVMGERLSNHQASAVETKTRVDDHDVRISALEVRAAEMKARMNYLGEERDD
jgi:hypothetical protein